MSTTTITQLQGFVHDRDMDDALDGQFEQAEAYAAKRRAEHEEIAGEYSHMTIEERERAIEAMLAPSKEVQAAAAAGTARLDHLTACENASATAAARSLETRDDGRQHLMAPAASTLQSALDAGTEGPDYGDHRAVYHAGHDIFCQLGTLADRWPRRARRSETGEWERSGVVTETLDAVCWGFERRCSRAGDDEARALKEFEIAERANRHGEIDAAILTAAEDRAIERREQVEFYTQLFHAARASYELLVGAPWQSNQRIKAAKALALGLAHTQLAKVSVYEPLGPDATQRVIVMGSGDADVMPALAKLKQKYPTLTLYSGNQTTGVEDQVARFALKQKVQLIKFSIDTKQHGRRAIFRRNELMMQAARPHGVVLVGPREHGPTDHLADLARAVSIPIWDLRPAPVARKAEAPPVGA